MGKIIIWYIIKHTGLNLRAVCKLWKEGLSENYMVYYTHRMFEGHLYFSETAFILLF